LTLGRDSDAVWRVNPRTGFLESRAGLSWTGVREYRTPTGLVRVLRRPEQVNSPGHLKTLRRLPGCEGHPPNGADVTPENQGELMVGYTGDSIDVEELGGYPRPVGNVTVTRLSTLAKMVDADTWRDYCGRFPSEAAKLIEHDGQPARTGTSLGYNALWYGPYVDSEIVAERDDGALVGEWNGPKGPERYDIEHIVDPNCDIVQRLEREANFDSEMLGGQHFAVCLAPLGGRGAEQSELMRVVDSHDLPIKGDLARRFNRVAVQVPRVFQQAPRSAAEIRHNVQTRTFDTIDATDLRWAARQKQVERIAEGGGTIPPCKVEYFTNEYGVLSSSFHFEGDDEPITVVPHYALADISKEYVIDLYLWSRDPHDEILGPGGEELPECKVGDAEPRWTVGVSRDLPVVPGDWDDDAVMASVFRWAGFDGDNPDPSKARQAFLVYDASEPNLKGSYKLPIARHSTSGLQVVKGGLDAAAGYLPQTDIPDDVEERARKVLDHYYTKYRKKYEPGAVEDRRASPEHRIMATTKIEIGLGRDNAKALAKLNLGTFQPLSLTLDEVNATKLGQKIAEMQEMLARLAEELMESKEKAEGMEAQMSDMMSVKEAEAKVDEVKGMLAEAEKALAEAKAAEEKMQSEMDAMKKQCDSYEAELAPLRAAEFKRFADSVVAAGFNEDDVSKCENAEQLRRLVVTAKVGERYGKTRDDGSFIADDDTVKSTFDGVWAMLQAARDNAESGPPSRRRSIVDDIPRIGPTPARDNIDGGKPSTSAQVQAGMACL
jgi:hypothetical protein